MLYSIQGKLLPLRYSLLSDIMRMEKALFIFFLVVILNSCKSSKQEKVNMSNFSVTQIEESMGKYLGVFGDKYPQYKEEVRVVRIKDNSNFHYRYNNENYKITVSNKFYSDYLPLFEKGILHPQLIRCFSFKFSTGVKVELSGELKLVEESKRRYRLWIWAENMMNPCENTIELFNELGTEHMSTKDFVKDAVVTYISETRVII